MAMKLRLSLLLAAAASPALASLLRHAAKEKDDCKSWCADSPKTWDQLCKKKNCLACPQCDTTTTTTLFTACKDWCSTSTLPWEKLCSRKNCLGCPQCDTTTTLSTGCQDWCSTSTRTWDQLCKRHNCNQCSECTHLACKSWCSTSTKPWEKLCKKKNCKSCGECSTTTSAVTECEPWCTSSTLPWTRLCKRHQCEACSECTAATDEGAAVATTTAAPMPTVNCSEPGGSRAVAHRGSNGYQYQVNCTGCPLNGTVWGTGPFFDNSSICGAAYFEGILGERGGAVVVTVLPGNGSYAAGSNARRSTSAYGPASGSFAVSAPPAAAATGAGGNATSDATATPQANASTPSSANTSAPSSVITCQDVGGASAVANRGMHGKEYQVDCTTGCDLHLAVWGADPFTDDSSICGAAYFLGVVDAQGRGTVKVTVGPGEPSYPDGSNSRRTTVSYGAWPGSFTIEGGSSAE